MSTPDPTTSDTKFCHRCNITLTKATASPESPCVCHWCNPKTPGTVIQGDSLTADGHYSAELLPYAEISDRGIVFNNHATGCVVYFRTLDGYLWKDTVANYHVLNAFLLTPEILEVQYGPVTPKTINMETPDVLP